MDATGAFEVERPRLLRLASRVLGDRTEAEDIVQRPWLRLNGAETDIESLPAWLTTVTTRLCLDRLRVRATVPEGEIEVAEAAPDPAEEVALADSVGVALQVVLDRLSPRERVAFVLHDSFGFEFSTIAAVLDTTTIAARKLASRARAKIGHPVAQDHLADWEVVDAFMAAARKAPSTVSSASSLQMPWWWPMTPQSCSARQGGSTVNVRWRTSSTALHTLRSRCTSETVLPLRGSTAGRRWSSSTSPSSTAPLAASPSVPSPRCSSG